MSFGEALANWKCVCGRGPSLEHGVGEYCSGRLVIEDLQQKLERAESENERLKGELEKSDWSNVQMEFARLENAVDRISIERDQAKAEIVSLHAMCERLAGAAQKAKKYLEPDLVEPGRTVFWELVHTLAAYKQTKNPGFDPCECGTCIECVTEREMKTEGKPEKRQRTENNVRKGQGG